MTIYNSFNTCVPKWQSACKKHVVKNKGLPLHGINILRIVTEQGARLLKLFDEQMRQACFVVVRVDSLSDFVEWPRVLFEIIDIHHSMSIRKIELSCNSTVKLTISSEPGERQETKHIQTMLT